MYLLIRDSVKSIGCRYRFERLFSNEAMGIVNTLSNDIYRKKIASFVDTHQKILEWV